MIPKSPPHHSTRPSLLTVATTLSLLIATTAATLPTPSSAQQPADPADVESIGAIMTAVYDVISGDAGEARDWDRFHSLFVPGATLSPVGRPQGSSAARKARPRTCDAS
jgi:hypothetical protein